MGKWLLFAFFSLVASTEADDLVLPKMSSGPPGAGLRVALQRAEYANTRVRHTLYLPTDWSEQSVADGKLWPVIVEYTGNYYPKAGSTGEVEDAALGYGLSGGRFIWLVLPYVSEDRLTNAITWWGDVEATVEYAKQTVPETCQRFGGDPDRVLICGFSRGAIGVNYIGLHDDEVAKLWAGFIIHDHYDGVRAWRGTSWGDPLERYRAEAAKRLARLNGRPVLVCQNGSTTETRDYLKSRTDLRSFTFVDVDTADILGPFPNQWAVHPHNDRWLLRDSAAGESVSNWIDRILKRSPNGTDGKR